MKKGWEIKKLGDVAEIKGGSTPLKSDKSFWENGKIPWFTISDIRNQGRIIKETEQKVTKKALNKLTLFPINTILLCCTASVGEYAITKIPITSNQQFNGLTIKDNNILIPEYLFYYCATLKDKLLSLSGKTTIDFVSNTKVSSLSIPIPPLSEQQRIVSVLDAAFAKIEAVKEKTARNLQNAKELFQSELQKCMSPQSSTNKKGWEIKELGDVAEIRPSKNDIIKNLKNNDEVSFLPMEDLGIMNYYINAKQKRELKEVNGSYTCFADGNVLLAKVTPCFENGKLGIAKNLINGVGFGSSEYIVFKPSQVLKSEFLYYLLSTFKFREDGKKHMLGACGLKRLSKDFVANFSIFVPPLSEQQQIVSRLDVLSAKVKQLEANYKAVLANCEELKQSVLAKELSAN